MLHGECTHSLALINTYSRETFLGNGLFFRKLRRLVPWDNTVPGGCRFPCIVIVTLYIEQKIQEREDVKATGGNIYMYHL